MPLGVPASALTGDSGYLFQILSSSDQAFKTQSTPAAPGKTGIETCTIDQTQRLTCGDYAGATQIQRQMFLRLAAIGANQLSGIILNFTGPITPEEIRAKLQSRTAVQDAFNLLDTDHNGVLSMGEVFGVPTGNTVNTVTVDTGNLFVQIRAEMAIGAGGENINKLPAVQFRQLGTDRLCGNGNPGQGNQAPCAIFPEPNDVGGKSAEDRDDQ